MARKVKFNRKVFHFLTLKSVRRHMVDRLGGNQPVAWCLPKYDNMNTDVYRYTSTPPNWIQTHGPSVRLADSIRLRLRGCCDWLSVFLTHINKYTTTLTMLLSLV